MLLPVFAFAQNVTYIDNWIYNATKWLNTAVTVIMVVMTLWFLISVFRFIANKDPNKTADYRKIMINGLIGLFVAVAVWGIIRLAANIFDVRLGNDPQSSITCPPGFRQGLNGGCVPN